MSFTPMFDELTWIPYCKEHLDYTEEKIQECIQIQRNSRLKEHLYETRCFWLDQPEDLRDVLYKILVKQCLSNRVITDEKLWGEYWRGKTWEQMTGLKITDKIYREAFSEHNDPRAQLEADVLVFIEELFWVTNDRYEVGSILFNLLLHLPTKKNLETRTAKIKKLKTKIRGLEHNRGNFQMVCHVKPSPPEELDYSPMVNFKKVWKNCPVDKEYFYDMVVEFGVLFIQIKDSLFPKAVKTSLALINETCHNPDIEDYFNLKR